MSYSNWIDVKDKLPNKGQKVIAVQNPETTATTEALFAKFNGKKFETINDNWPKSDKASAWVDIILWMPLPKVPRANGFEFFNASGELDGEKLEQNIFKVL